MFWNVRQGENGFNKIFVMGSNEGVDVGILIIHGYRTGSVE